jgi:hypothetical protein
MRANGGAVGEGSGKARVPEASPTAFAKAKKAE